MINPLEDAINLFNSFEKAILTTRFSPNRSFWTKVPLKQLNHLASTDDFSEYLNKLSEESKKYSNYNVTKREFSLKSIDNTPYLILNVDFYEENRSMGRFFIPFSATIEDYVAIKEE